MAKAKAQSSRKKKPPRCAGTKRDGSRCTRTPKPGTKFCAQHGGGARRIRDWKALWLTAFASSLTVVEACAAADVGRRTVYTAREQDPEFAAAWDAIFDETTDRLEREMIRRGMEGVVEREEWAVLPDGERIQSLKVTKYSDNLLMFALKARKPDTYRENHTVEHTGPGGKAPAMELVLDAGVREAISGALRRRPAAGQD